MNRCHTSPPTNLTKVYKNTMKPRISFIENKQRKQRKQKKYSKERSYRVSLVRKMKKDYPRNLDTKR